MSKWWEQLYNLNDNILEVVNVELVNGPNKYLINSLVAKSTNSNFYICRDDKKQYFLQVAATIEQNSKLDFATYVLKELKRISDIYEKIFQTRFPGEELNYDWLFPTVVDSFSPKDQGGRMVNVLAINSGDALEQMVPLSNILNKDRKIIDLATSVWIMGRILKLLVLAHDQCISPMISGDNIIIEPKKHHVIILDWINSKMHQGEITEDARMNDISNAASVILTALGENYERPTNYPDNVYIDFLKSLVTKPRFDTEQVYRDFESAHGKVLEHNIFYPFTTFPI